MTSRRESVLREMGLGPLWRLRAAQSAALPERFGEDHGPATQALQARDVASPAADASAPPTALAAVPGSAQTGTREAEIARMDWNALREAAAGCRACRLCETRKQAVLGVGDTQADWLFVGEGPGAEEDERGEPFVGQAGKLLDAMIASLGLKRGNKVYIANAVKCRPPNNRTPEPDEIAACFPFLKRQVELLQPKLVVALGRPAAQALLDREVKIGAARGQVFEYLGVPLIVTYHPAYLLRNLGDKAKSWEDLCFARSTMNAGAAREAG